MCVLPFVVQERADAKCGYRDVNRVRAAASMRSDNSGSSTARAKLSAPTIVATMASASSSDLRRPGTRLAIRFVTARTATVKLRGSRRHGAGFHPPVPPSRSIAAPFPMVRGQVPGDVLVESPGAAHACRTRAQGVTQCLRSQALLRAELAI